MAIPNRHGRARLDPTAPSAFAICDTCSFEFLRSDLYADKQWYGTRIQDTGYLVCDRCLDKPQEQLRTIILPPDPIPVSQPRPDFLTAREYAMVISDTNGNPIFDSDGFPIFDNGFIPTPPG